MKKNQLSYFHIIISAIFTIMFFALLGGMAIYCLHIGTANETKKDNTENIDWEQLYPFSEEPYVEENRDDTSTVVKNSKISILNHTYTGAIGKLNYWISTMEEYLPKYEKLLVCRDYIKRIWCKCIPYTSNTVISLGDGYYTNIRTSKANMDYYSKSIEAVNNFHSFLSEENIPFLYVQTPVKICEKDTIFNNKTDYTNDNINLYLNMLKEKNTDILDLREKLHLENKNHHEMFYRTDHHWTVDSGLWASREITDVLKKKYGMEIDDKKLDPIYFESTIYEDTMFGSNGVSVGRFYAEPEDFIFYYPTFETKMQVIQPDKKVNILGSFDDTMIDMDRLSKLMEDGGGYAYESILRGNRPLTNIKNKTTSNKLKVLVINDSFSLAIAPYLALVTNEVDMIDIRPYNGNFTGSVRTYIKETQPDIVLMIYSNPVIEGKYR